MQPSIMRPSPSGPFWCWQTFETAEILPSYRKIATRSPEIVRTQARFSGISSTAQASTNSSFEEISLSKRLSLKAAAKCSAVIRIIHTCRRYIHDDSWSDKLCYRNLVDAGSALVKMHGGVQMCSAMLISSVVCRRIKIPGGRLSVLDQRPFKAL